MGWTENVPSVRDVRQSQNLSGQQNHSEDLEVDGGYQNYLK
jgi:hypothetical protein